MKILFGDLATQSGFAVGEHNGTPVAWTEKLAPGDHAQRFLGMALVFRRLIAEHRPDKIGIEAPYLDMTAPDAARFLYGMRGAVLLTARSLGYDVHEVEIGRIRKHFIGKHPKGQAKARTMDRCRVLKWDYANDDEADALAGWETLRGLLKASSLPVAGGLF